jgi:hypothetical protein
MLRNCSSALLESTAAAETGLSVVSGRALSCVCGGVTTARVTVERAVARVARVAATGFPHVAEARDPTALGELFTTNAERIAEALAAAISPIERGREVRLVRGEVPETRAGVHGPCLGRRGGGSRACGGMASPAFAPPKQCRERRIESTRTDAPALSAVTRRRVQNLDARNRMRASLIFPREGNLPIRPIRTFHAQIPVREDFFRSREPESNRRLDRRSNKASRAIDRLSRDRFRRGQVDRERFRSGSLRENTKVLSYYVLHLHAATPLVTPRVRALASLAQIL